MNAARSSALIAAIATLFFFAAPAFGQAVPGFDGEKKLGFDANEERSQLKFVSEAPVEKIVGVAQKVDGTLVINLKDLSKTKGSVSVPVAAMNTGNKMRDKHMQSKDWLNAKANPKIIYTVEGLKNAKVVEESDAKVVIAADAIGQVLVNGVPAPKTAKIKMTIAKKESGGAHAVKVEPAFTVALADHKVAGKKGVVGNKVGKTIEVSGTLYGKAQ